MNYTMKEIQETCSVSRKTLRNYIKHDLLQPIKKDRLLYFTDLDITHIQCIQYFHANGMQLAQIKDILDEGVVNTNACNMIQEACVKVEKEVTELQEQYVMIERVLNNLHDYKKIDQIDHDTIMHMQNDHMILDRTMIPIKIAGVYVEKDIYCTKKEYFLLQKTVHIFLVLMIVTFIIAMLEKWGNR